MDVLVSLGTNAAYIYSLLAMVGQRLQASGADSHLGLSQFGQGRRGQPWEPAMAHLLRSSSY